MVNVKGQQCILGKFQGIKNRHCLCDFVIMMSWQFKTTYSHLSLTIFDKSDPGALHESGQQRSEVQRWKAKQVERKASLKTQGPGSCVWRPAEDGEKEVVKVGWHWFVEKEKMLFLKSKN